jgi:hypothetical protein
MKELPKLPKLNLGDSISPDEKDGLLAARSGDASGISLRLRYEEPDNPKPSLMVGPNAVEYVTGGTC